MAMRVTRVRSLNSIFDFRMVIPVFSNFNNSKLAESFMTVAFFSPSSLSINFSVWSMKNAGCFFKNYKS